jgi:hypothetical protein
VYGLALHIAIMLAHLELEPTGEIVVIVGNGFMVVQRRDCPPVVLSKPA